MNATAANPTAGRRRGRPPKHPGDHRETRATLIRTGVVALTRTGFTATGLDQILRAAGIPKGSFYHYFASKEAFGTALIDHYADYFARRMDRRFTDESRSPLRRLHDFVEDGKAGMARFEFRRGCLIGNLGQEMEALPESYRDKLCGVFADWQGRIARCLLAAQAAGEIPPERDCNRLATFFLIGWEGAVLRAKLERSADPLVLFAEFFFAGLPPIDHHSA